MLHWEWKTFSELSGTEIYHIWAHREQIFIVEQNESYLDADGKDLSAWHLCGWSNAEKSTLAAYARLILPTEPPFALRFGRVAVASDYRKRGIAKKIIEQIFDRIKCSPYPHYPIYISAQEYLVNFYRDYGFEIKGERYFEGAIPHQDMYRLPLVPNT